MPTHHHRARSLAAALLTLVLAMTGVALLPAALGPNARIAYEVAWDADLTDADGSSWTWTDITTDVRHASGPVSATLGRADESSSASPGRMSLTLENPDGRYTPYNALGANWPNVKPGVPIRRRVSLNGGATWYIRWQGQITRIERSAALSGGNATVTITAAGVRQRLAQDDPLFSPGRRSVAAAAPLAFWPGEDDTGAGLPGSALPGGMPMELSAGGAPSFGETPPAGWAGAVGAAAGPRLVGLVPTSTGTLWTVELWAKLDPTGDQSLTLFSVDTPGGSVIRWEFVAIGSLHAVQVKAWTSGSTISSSSSGTPGVSPGYFDGEWHLFTVVAGTDGATMVSDIYVDGVKVDTSDTVVAGTTSVMPARVTLSPLQSGSPSDWTAWCGLAVWASDQSSGVADRYSAGLGWAGETPHTRAARLCGEETVDLSTVDYLPTSPRTMGPQPTGTLLALLDECATTDAATIHDGLGPGLRWQSIDQRYDQAVALTLDAAELAETPAPTTDDSRLRNRAVVSQSGGSSATHTDTDGPLGTAAVGIWTESTTVNLSDPDTPGGGLAGRARWQVHAGTVPGERFPSLTVDVAAVPSLAARLLSTTNGWTGQVLPGWRLDLTGLSDVGPEHPDGTLDLVIEGWTEDIDPRGMWKLTLNVSPQRTYDVWKIGDSQLGRIGTDGHTLAADAAKGATSLSLATPTGKALWTTAAGDFPMTILVAGIPVTVTAITGTSSPQTATVTGATVTKALTTGDAVTMYRNGVIKL